MAPQCSRHHHRTARPAAATRRGASENHAGFKSSNNPVYSHINIQERAPTADTYSDTNTEEDFIRNRSLQHEIEEQLLSKDTLATNPETPDRPLTFAEATMSTKNKDRKNSLKGGGASLGGPTSLGSLGPFKYTLKKKKKKYNKWSPFDLSNPVDSRSEVGSNSEKDVDVGSSRAASPNLQPTLGFASFPSSPQRSTSTLAVASVSPPTDQSKGPLFEAELDFNNIGQAHQAPTLDSYEFAVRAAPDEGKGWLIERGELDLDEIGDTHKTPTQDSYEFGAPVSAPSGAATDSLLAPIEYDGPLNEVESPTSDTQSTKDRREAAMASIARAFGASKAPKLGEDPFDSLEWDPALPSASVPDSPEPVEPVIAAPQPRAYTTVGSLVDPNAVPQFTAPNRIQREGAGRRPLLTFMQPRPLMSTRHQEPSYFPPRDPPTSLSMQDSMHYAQQLSQSPVRLYQAHQPKSSHSSRSTMSRQQMSLTDEEMNVLRRVGGPQMVSGNSFGSPFGATSFRNQYHKSLASKLLSENRKLPDQVSPPKIFTNNRDSILPTVLPSDLIEDGQRRSIALSGLEKMQTIQRLAKFENPMQELARNRLSALSVTNNLGRTVANPNGLPTSSTSSTTETMSRPLGAPKQGELDRTYQFPPPGFENSPMSQPNPLLGTYGPSSYQVAPANRPLGVPQPLTAGPPGQRQYLASGANNMSSSFDESRQVGGETNNPSTSYCEYSQNGAFDPRSQYYNPSVNHQAIANPLSQNLKMDSPIQPSIWQYRAPAFDGEQVGSKVVDSLPVSNAAKYYPGGFPSDMTGNFAPLSYPMKLKMGHVAGVKEPPTATEKEAARCKERDDWFYSGQRAYGKTTTDHINDLEYRETARTAGPYGPIGPPPRTTVEKKPITAEEMDKMTIVEATIPLINAAFGRLVSFADETSDSESGRHLSGFVKADDYLIDNSAEGNKSFFGEDWGPPPQRLDGSSRWQSSLHRPSSTPWE